MEAAEISIRSISPGLWAAGLGILFVAVALGFAAGYMCARSNDRRAYARSRSSIGELFSTIIQTLETLRDLCVKLESYPGTVLRPEQTAELERRRGGFLESLARLIRRNASLPVDPPADEPRPCTEAQKVTWAREPIDPGTQLPGRTAFDANLVSMQDLCRAARCDCCLLLVRVDKAGALVGRLGQPGAEKLLRQLAGVVARAVRDDDLVCRVNSDTLGVLLPWVDLESGGSLSRAVRDAVRSQHYRADPAGPEVLLTASFGCTAFRPDEKPEPVMNRALDALSRSQRIGRNQLHAHDGESLAHCPAI